jgi:Tfp pilus assembly major pilin PilA
MIKNQKGFAVLETLLILVIIAIIGGTGYFVWHSRNQTNNSLDNTTKVNQTDQSQKSQSSNKSTVLTSYDPVQTPDIIPKLSANMKAQKLIYNYMIIGEWKVKASTVETDNTVLPYYLNYRYDVTDSNNILESVVVFSGADDSGNDKTCVDGAAGPVVYMMRDITADSLGFSSYQPISDLNVGGHVFHIYEEHCGSDTNKTTASAIERQLETLAVSE